MAKIILICSNKSIVKDLTAVAHHKGCEFEHYTEQEWSWKNNNNVISLQSKLLHDPLSKKETLKDIQMKAIQKAIIESNGNISKAARILYIGRATLYRKIKKSGIDIDNIRTDQKKKTATKAAA